jgi:phosphomannomutase/phosphoglucomutase
MYMEGEAERSSWDRVGEISLYPEGRAIADYTDFLAARLTSPRPLKVVVDPGNGAATLVAQDLLRRVGHEVVSLFGEVDGTFPNRSPHPTEKSLGALMEAVPAHGADLGVGYDADGDRCIFVDDKGRVVQTEKVGILVSRDLLREHKGKVIANVPCSMIVEDELEKDGAEVVRVRVGDVFVCEEIKRHGGIFAMEISAHFFLPTYYIFDDPMLMTLKLAELVGADGRALSAIVDEIPSYPFVELGFQCDDDIKFRVNELVEEHFRAQGAGIDTTDGVKVMFEDGWAMLRPSNTQPLIRLFAEARTRPRLDELVAEFTDLFEEMRDRAASERS